MAQCEIKGIHIGKRDENFKTLIVNVLKSAKIKSKYVEVLTSKKYLQEYSAAFTHEMASSENICGVDGHHNYQVYEQLGDLAGNQFIVWYIYRRFPQLICAEGVKVAARLRINYGSKMTFAKFAEDLGFWDYITATNELRARDKNSLLEDVFEAFLGATATILDNEFGYGVGYACVYKILASIFDKIEISLKYEDLYDAKTRLKELFDIHSEKLGPVKWVDNKDEITGINTCTVYAGRREIGRTSAQLKGDSQQLASAEAIKVLATEGYVKHAPKLYARFANNLEPEPTTVEDVKKYLSQSADQSIDSQLPTRGKSKHQCKYTSTVLAMYTRRRDYEGIKICLKLGANPNQTDSEGMTVTDLLLLGPNNPELVKKILKKFIIVAKGEKLLIHKNIYDSYYQDYEEKFVPHFEFI